MNQPPAGNRRPSAPTIIAVILILIVAVLTIVGGATALQLPDSVTEESKQIKSIYLATLIISLIVFFGVTSGIIWAIFRYRRVDDRIPEQIHGSNILEISWTVVPVIILVALFIPSLLIVIDLKEQPSEDEADLVVEAIGHQWWWEFNYPDEGVTVQATPPNYDNLVPPALVVPVGETVLIRVRSTDVVHSFYAINTLYKLQAIPGNVNEMHITVDEPGVFYGQCYQFCGLRHSDMLFVLDARPRDEYEQWLNETKQAQGVPVEDGAQTKAD